MNDVNERDSGTDRQLTADCHCSRACQLAEKKRWAFPIERYSINLYSNIPVTIYEFRSHPTNPVFSFFLIRASEVVRKIYVAKQNRKKTNIETSKCLKPIENFFLKKAYTCAFV